MRLTPPSFPIFMLSLVMVAAVVALRYLGVELSTYGIDVPFVADILSSAQTEVLLAAYGLLAVGVVFKGI